MIKMTIPLIPKAQMRARHGRTKNGLSITYKANNQRQNEQSLISLLVPYRPAKALTDAIKISFKAFLPIPTSWSKKKKCQAINGEIRPTGRPDLDNYEKNLNDVLTQLSFWHDDAQIVSSNAAKYYDDGNGPRWEIEIQRIGDGK